MDNFFSEYIDENNNAFDIVYLLNFAKFLCTYFSQLSNRNSHFTQFL